MTRRLGRCTVLICLAFTACQPTTGPEGNTIDTLPRQLTTAERQLIDSGNKFAFELFRAVNGEEDPAANVFISPLSASMALAMTLNGAQGATWDAMSEGLGFGELSQSEINESYQDLIGLLRTLDRRVELEIGNSLWNRIGFEVEPEFRSDVEDFFQARAEALDFDDPASAGLINAWVEGATGGRIREIVEPPIDPLTEAFLINAVYFRGTWTLQFDPADTRDAPFRRPDGSSVSVPMMAQSDGSFPYASTGSYQAVELPYGGEAFAMTVVLPAGGTEIAGFATALDAAYWESILAALVETDVVVLLPKFRLEYEKLLNDALATLGMGIAFDGKRADFSLMHRDATEMELHISRVKQKAFIEVDEEGTEAAAATAVEVGVTSAPTTMIVDRPFVFAIRERLSGSILFVGRITDPSAD
jgi:serpin B